MEKFNLKQTKEHNLNMYAYMVNKAPTPKPEGFHLVLAYTQEDSVTQVRAVYPANQQIHFHCIGPISVESLLLMINSQQFQASMVVPVTSTSQSKTKRTYFDELIAEMIAAATVMFPDKKQQAQCLSFLDKYKVLLSKKNEN